MIDFQRFLRKEGDSNPRFPLGEYTLSRRASSATRAPFHIPKNDSHCHNMPLQQFRSAKLLLFLRNTITFIVFLCLFKEF